MPATSAASSPRGQPVLLPWPPPRRATLKLDVAELRAPLGGGSASRCSSVGEGVGWGSTPRHVHYRLPRRWHIACAFTRALASDPDCAYTRAGLAAVPVNARGCSASSTRTILGHARARTLLPCGYPLEHIVRGGHQACVRPPSSHPGPLGMSRVCGSCSAAPHCTCCANTRVRASVNQNFE